MTKEQANVRTSARGKGLLSAINRTVYLTVGLILATSAGWLLVAAGSSGDSLATGALVLGITVGAWLKGYRG